MPVERTLLALDDFYPGVEGWLLPHVVGFELPDQVLPFQVVASLNIITILEKSWAKNKIKKLECLLPEGSESLYLKG
jgi:hypothetical protein